MATTLPNTGAIIPAMTEPADQEVNNAAFTAIDTAVGAIDGEVGFLKGQIAGDSIISGFDCNFRDDHFRFIRFYNGVNAPTSDLSIMLHLPYSSDWISQEVHSITATGLKVYYRIFHSGSQWGPWTQRNL